MARGRVTSRQKPTISSSTASSVANTRFTEHRELPIRTTSVSVLYYFERSQSIWHWLLVSFAIDLVLLCSQIAIPFTEHALERLHYSGLALLIIGSLGLLREPIIDRLDWVRTRYDDITSKTQRYSWIGALIAVAAALFEIVLRFGSVGILVIVACLLVGIRSFYSAQKTLREHMALRQQRRNDRVLLLDDLNRQLFLASIVPMACVRASSLLLILQTQAVADSTDQGLIYIGAAILVFLALLPQREHFVCSCPRCARWTSRALKHLGYCPVCTREKFQVNERA
ncbi:MAG: hypothetical protein K1X79_08665 [Oligoflexia bacterium]|nr:hypothetical protein [Oligoflexia bacterium]